MGVDAAPDTPAATASDEHWMRLALAEARCAGAAGEVPVGAVVVRDGELLGSGRNRSISASDPTLHAEIDAIRAAALRLGNYRLPGCALYVTVEPCLMCAGALVHGRIERLVYGSAEPKTGAVESAAQVLRSPAVNHRVKVSGGVLAAECAALRQAFFKARR